MKYMGSKARIISEIAPILLKDRKHNQWYVEPFAGGMNSIAYISGLRIANDNNIYLIEMWKHLLQGWKPEKITREEYIHVRDHKAMYPHYYVGWVGFNCSYSGKWFAGYAGDTKTKSGIVRDYQSEAIRNINKQLPLLSSVVFTHTSYTELIIPQGSIIYADPPYQSTTSYHNTFDHVLFWNWVREMHIQGHTVYVSEYNAPPDFTCIWSKSVTSSMSANGKYGANKQSIEKLFIYGR